MANQLKTLLLICAGAVFFSACKKEDDPAPINEGEEITTVKLTFTPSTGTPVQISWKDADGAGGAAPVITPAQLALSPSTTYAVKVQFLDESKSPAEDITEEVVEESDEHEVFYQVSNGLALGFSNYNTDKSTPALKLGTTATANAATTGTGTLTVTLKHKAKNSGTPKAANDPVTKGETDVEVVFPVRIQ